MRRRLLGLALCAGCCVGGGVLAEDNVLLIQTGPQGYVVWHTEGESQLDDDALLEIMATALPEGGAEVATALGPARAYEVNEAVLIRLPAARDDNALLVERDACGHVKAWHAAGKLQLSDEQLTEIMLSALPGGGKRLRLNGRYAKAFTTRLGVTATLWPVPPPR